MEAQTAAFVARRDIVRAVAGDVVRWVAPVGVALAALFVPVIGAHLIVALAVLILGVSVSAALVLIDARALANYGYTESLRRRGYRVIDIDSDTVLYRARHGRKSLLKLVAGRYEVIAL